MMNQISPKMTPFSAGWFSSGGLGPLRSCGATYCLVPYENLPLISEAFFQGTLHWLTPLETDLQQEQRNYPPPTQWKSIKLSTDQLGIALPKTFQWFMNSPELPNRIPSCTNCYFGLSEKLVPCPGSEEGYIIRFFNTGQGQLAWYLYLTTQGEHCVLVGYPLLDLLSNPESPEYRENCITEEERNMAFEGRGTLVCASSFEEFLYRFWIENSLWYKLVWYKGQKPLTEEENRYLSYYQTQQDQE
jgi:hypothetical protein